MTGRLLVVGSLNLDLVVRCARAPAAGETLIGESLTRMPGGKGANQAVAAARALANPACHAATPGMPVGPVTPVIMVGCVGADEFGLELRASLRAAGVGDTAVRTSTTTPTGTALILVEGDGQNRIVVIPGANGEVAPADVQALGIAPGDVVVLQLEIPFATVAAVVRHAHARGATVLLNAAPADARARELAADVDHLFVNEVEAAALVGAPLDSEPAEERAVRSLHGLGFKAVTLTLGGRGALHADAQHRLVAQAPRVCVVDTTAAGDAFVGGWAAAELLGLARRDCLARAIAAGSLAVTHPGAQPSLPGAAAIADLVHQVVIHG